MNVWFLVNVYVCCTCCLDIPVNKLLFFVVLLPDEFKLVTEVDMHWCHVLITLALKVVSSCHVFTEQSHFCMCFEPLPPLLSIPPGNVSLASSK